MFRNIPAGRWVLAAATFVAFAVAIAFIYVRGEDHLYLTDFRVFWIWYWKSGVSFRENGLAFWLREIRDSVWASDYNVLAVSLLLPFSLTFGYARNGYIIALTVIFLVPAAILSARATFGIVRSEERSTWVALIFGAVAALYAPYWTPVLRGYPDIAGLIPLSIAFIMVRELRFGARFYILGALVLGVMIWLPFGFRRWYAFSIVAMAMTAPIYSFFSALQQSVPWPQAFRSVALNYFIVGAVALCCGLFFQGALIQSVLKTSYSTIYVAYQKPPLAHLQGLWNYFGPLAICLALAAQAALLTKCFNKLDVIFIDANLILVFVLFTQTQRFGYQHYLPVAFWLLLLNCLAIYMLAMAINFRRARAVVAVGIVAALIFGNTFFRRGALPSAVATILPARILSERTGEMEKYSVIVAAIQSRLRPGDKWTVMASSSVLTRDILLSASNESLTGSDVDIAHVDLRDGIMIAPLMARYVIVADPVQTHLPPEAQTVVTIPAHQILSGKGIGAAYKKLDFEADLRNGVKVYIYEKTRLFTASEVAEMLELFFKRYPEWRSHYGQNFVLALTIRSKIGDLYGRFDYDPATNQILIHPGNTTPTTATLAANGTTLDLKMVNNCDAGDGIKVKLSSGTDVLSDQILEPKQSMTIVLPNKPSEMVDLEIEKRGQPWCDLVALGQR